MFTAHGHPALLDELPAPPARETGALRDAAGHHAAEEGHARRIDAETVVVAGDVWARGILIRRLPVSLRGRVTTVEGAVESEPGRALLEQRLESLFRGRMATHDRALLDSFLAERARDGAFTEGLAPAVSALQRSRVKAFFLNASLPREPACRRP
ncbi:hypothetical protein PUR34_04490 [Streptomyces sp. JV185]|uniref:baeRF2 domain-containing protein n=1 Tax=Streptomyces sp. JV185 TaxID=858638 RepID=UPI002E77FC43|nr:hypothetical protein [Streptomyces sp. JV185]MEE1767455.1 hypothetical protein [Streptomyces sp. JV185]